MTFRHAAERLKYSLANSSLAFDLKKALVLMGGTLLLAMMAGAEGIKYSGKDLAISNLLKSPELQMKMGISCKLISENSGLVHEFDSLGDFEVPGLGMFSPQSSEEHINESLRARISLTEASEIGLGSGFANKEYQVQLQFSGKADFPLNGISGRLKVGHQEESSLVIDLNSHVFLTCVNMKALPVSGQGIEISLKNN